MTLLSISHQFKARQVCDILFCNEPEKYIAEIVLFAGGLSISTGLEKIPGN